MRRLYRVLPWSPRAAEREPGHPLYVPPSKGSDRLGNPESYSALYLSSSPTGAVAEAFGHVDIWTSAMFSARGKAVRALVEFQLTGRSEVLDLDDPRALVVRSLRPSSVVSRDRDATQRWAKAIYDENHWIGVEWWSYYDPRWSSLGLWTTKALMLSEQPTPLQLDHPAVLEAASVLVRRIAA